jgi:hypothetical protein
MAIRTRSLLGAIASSIVAACYSPDPEPPISSTTDDSESSDGDDDDDDGSDESSESGTDCDVDGPPSESPCVVDDGLGVFVATYGDDDALGTKDAPMATVAAALQRAASGSRRVYACAQDFAGDTLVVTGDVALFGGLDCDDDWRWVGDARRTRYVADGIALRIAGAVDVLVEDFELTATDATISGASSFAVIVHDATRATFRRAHVEAGAASAGADAIALEDPAGAGPDGEAGRDSDCLPIDTEMVGIGATNLACPASAGGTGGAQEAYGDAGSPRATGGEPGTVNTFAGACTPGGDGIDGTIGEHGEGARGLGSLDVEGWIAPSAHDGADGAVGGGGGGGGGGLPPGLSCSVSDVNIEFDILAPGGGGGGAGGCGGVGGHAGESGGSSIAIVAIDAAIVLESTTIATADAGDGGVGATGQPGGDGGEGGIGGVPIDPGPYGGGGVGDGTCASAGGHGGTGGRGGTGGFGSGGHSVGVAYRGPAPVLGYDVEFVLGSAGLGGGESDVQSDDGTVAQVLAFE